ncbi:MAG: Ig-like domain-containing protein [Bryobacteraceae bacterium]
MSSTLLTSNANPTTTENLVLTAAINANDATGTVTFFDGTTMLRSIELSGGTARLSDPSSIVQVVFSSTSTLTLTSDGQPTTSNGQTVYVSMLNSPTTFTAMLTPATASGTVQFFDGPTSLRVQPVSGGTAAFTTSSLTLGNHTISAVYNGDAFFMPSWAAPLTQQVRNTEK